MSNDSSFLKNTLDLIENDPEIKSYIYQQIQDFNAFVTPETLVMVIARDPLGRYDQPETEVVSSDMEASPSQIADFDDEGGDFIDEDDITDEMRKSRYRIAVVLKDGDHAIEAESFNDDIFEAIRLSKEALIEKLLEIQEEVESPKDRMIAIQQASENKPIH
jgi:hypothetical protein